MATLLFITIFTIHNASICHHKEHEVFSFLPGVMFGFIPEPSIAQRVSYSHWETMRIYVKKSELMVNGRHFSRDGCENVASQFAASEDYSTDQDHKLCGLYGDSMKISWG